MGYDVIVVLDGGFLKWVFEGCLVISELFVICDCYMFVCFCYEMVKDVIEVSCVLKLMDYMIIDVCVVDWFKGEVVELCSGMCVGYILNLCNVFFSMLLNVDKIMKEFVVFKVIFENVGVDLIKFVIIFCGLGVMVVVLCLVMECFGKIDYFLYDGFWIEWGVFLMVFIVIGDV